MLDRIFKSWKTSLVGVFIILFCSLAIWFEKATIEAGFTGMTIALLFFYAKDTNESD